MDKFFICLANSYKHGGRCIAGVEVEWKDSHWHIVRDERNMPKWVRPICRETNTGEIPNDMALGIQPFGVVRLTDVEICAEGAQTENVYFCQMEPTAKSFKSCEELFARLADDSHRHIFYNYGRAVTPSIYQHEGNHSILLVKAEDAEIYVDTTVEDKVRYRLRFNYYDHSYDFPITDPSYIDAIRQGTVTIGWRGTLYVACSLGLLHEGWHHKLAAGVYECESLGQAAQSVSLGDCEQQLAQLLDQKEELESRIQALRTKFQKQMENRHMERFSSNKLTISYNPTRQVMQFDSTAFKTDYPELYEQYCRPRQREASITVKRNG